MDKRRYIYIVKQEKVYKYIEYQRSNSTILTFVLFYSCTFHLVLK